MQVEGLTQATSADWQAFVASHPDSTVYHSLGWRQIFERSFGYRSFYLMARDETGKVTGCLPLFLVASPMSRRLVAVPFRDRGAILWTQPDAFSSLLGTVKELAREHRVAYVELKTVEPYPQDLREAGGLDEQRYWVRSVVDLRELTVDELWKKVGAKTRNMIRQAESAGLEFRDETSDPAGLAAWYRLFLETQKRQGIPPFPLRFFQTMLEELSAAGEVKLFVVRKGGEPVSATILLLHKKVGIYGYSASSRAGQAHRPNDFMLFNAAKWLLENRFEQFDLGSDAPTQESLLFFKRKWLAEQTPVPLYTLGEHNLAQSDSSNPRYRMLRKAFQHLPTPISRLVGAVTCRYFG